MFLHAGEAVSIWPRLHSYNRSMQTKYYKILRDVLEPILMSQNSAKHHFQGKKTPPFTAVHEALYESSLYAKLRHLRVPAVLSSVLLFGERRRQSRDAKRHRWIYSNLHLHNQFWVGKLKETSEEQFRCGSEGLNASDVVQTDPYLPTRTPHSDRLWSIGRGPSVIIQISKESRACLFTWVTQVTPSPFT